MYDAGQLGFTTSLRGARGTSGATSSVVFNKGLVPRSDDLFPVYEELVARKGDLTPGSTTERYDRFDGAVALNNARELRYSAVLTNSFSGVGIFDENGAVLKERDGAPGTGGATFRFLGTSSIDLNDSGEMAFAAQLEGQGVMEDNNGGLFTSTGVIA